MHNWVSIALPMPALALIACGLLPDAWVNAHVNRFRRLVTTIALLQFAFVAAAAIALLGGWSEATRAVTASLPSSFPVQLTVVFDGVASLMLVLVSFISWVICQYSIRYLDGEQRQGTFFRWTAFTIGSVSLMVISGNLLMFIACWIATSLGLHSLLLHYSDRPAARRAAWTKFFISRLGDGALLAAMLLLYREFKTLDFDKMFAALDALPAATPSMQAISFLLVLGALSKSAQFPFHTWLPQTMETPTPVSALMHAGIVNAGGYLLIRTSPLISHTPWAMTTLAVVGGITALFAAIVMTTQTSIKKSLAYSTIAQMGFMILQCGLGAYSSAMLHIIAHSLYKAYAFLSSGSAVADRQSQKNTQPAAAGVSTATYAAALAATWIGIATLLCSALVLFGINPLTKPSGLLLGAILTVALTSWIAQVLLSGSRVLLLRAAIVASGLCFMYAASFAVVDKAIAASVASYAPPAQLLVLSAAVLLGFGGLLAMQIAARVPSLRMTFLRLHVHASNAFYVENILRRIFKAFAIG